MSNRISSTDDDNPIAYLWDSQVERAIHGKRGQALIRELRTALEAMPRRELCVGALATPEGSVCPIGALAEARGMFHGTLLRGADDDTALWARDRLSMTFTLAWEIVDRNDSFHGTPSQRWQRMLDWCNDNLGDRESNDAPAENRAGGPTSNL